MSEKFSEKQEKVQEKIQKQQELNDKDCRELTDEELDQIVGGKSIAPPDPEIHRAKALANVTTTVVTVLREPLAIDDAKA